MEFENTGKASPTTLRHAGLTPTGGVSPTGKASPIGRASPTTLRHANRTSSQIQEQTSTDTHNGHHTKDEHHSHKHHTKSEERTHHKDKHHHTHSDKNKHTLSSDKDNALPSDKDTLSTDKDKQTPSDKDAKGKKEKKHKDKKSDKDKSDRKRKTLNTVRQDHMFIQKGIENLLSMDCSNDENKDAKQRLLNDVIVYLSQHAVAEEIVVYHSVKKIDKHKSEDAKKQNIELEKLLYQIDREYGTNIDNPEKLDEKLKELQKLFSNHIENEETNILQTLEKDYPNEKIENINDWYLKVKQMAPTRPHPDGPHNVVGQIATGPAIVFVDMIRDMKKKFNYD